MALFSKLLVLSKPLLLLSRFSGIAKYYAIVAVLIITKNFLGIVGTAKLTVAQHETILGKLFAILLTFIEFFTKKALYSDIGIYEATNKLKAGGVTTLQHVNLLTDIFLGVVIIFLVFYAILKFDAFVHTNIVGLGAVVMGLLVLYFSMGYVGVKLTKDIGYSPFEGTLSFAKLVWANPDILRG